MQSLKELREKIYKDLQGTDWINQYPELNEISTLSEYLQELALDMMPEFIEKDKLGEFVDASEKNYKESTFKEYIEDYNLFLDKVEEEFYNSLLLGLTEGV